MAAPFYVQAENTAVEQVIVSGTRSDQASVEIPASIQILTAEQIKLSGASNLIQALNAQAGMQISDKIGNNGRGAAISMRGFGENNANNVLVLVDGRRLNNPSLASPNLASIAIKDIERVEIIQGSAGTLYGDQATGGVINIITKKTEGSSAYLETARGSDDLETYRGAVSQRFDNGMSYRISAEKKLADNYRDNNESNYSNVLTNLAYANATFKVFGEALQVDDQLNLAGELSPAQIKQDRRQTNTPDNYTNEDTRSYRLGGELALNSHWQALAEYTDRDIESDGINGSQWFDYTIKDSTTEVKSFNPRLTGTIANARGNILITTGADLQESNYESTFVTRDSSQDISDIYGQAVIPVHKALKVTLGARHSALDENDKTSGADNDASLSVYQVGASHQLDQDTRLFLRRDESFRWANLDENAWALVPAGEILKPQEGTSWEAGIEQQFSAFKVSVMAFDLSLENEIFYDPSAGFNSNLKKSDRQGLVLDELWQVNDQFSLQLNYNYVDAKISDGVFSGNRAPFVAKHTANLIANYQINDNWSIYTDAQYTGQRYKAGDEGNIAGQLGGYTIYNANVRWDHNNLYLNLRANNITGKDYNGYHGYYNYSDYFTGDLIEVEYAYPAARDSFELSLGYNF
jgi:iron complex outermembrane receptor protein